MMAFVVEDERDQRNLVREELEEAGWTVEVAEDGIAALGRLRRVQPDVILLDLRMPRLDGIQMLKMLRSNVVERAIPVIIMTGSEVASCVRLFAHSVLMKPFSSDELTQALASCTSGLSDGRASRSSSRSSAHGNLRPANEPWRAVWHSQCDNGEEDGSRRRPLGKGTDDDRYGGVPGEREAL
jgi:CheY-like chemotaxis protein